MIRDTIATHVYEMREGACVNTRIVEPVVPEKKKKTKKGNKQR